jgi:hypothetical protein
MSGEVAATGLKVACCADFCAVPAFPSEEAINRPDGETEAAPIPSRNVNNILEALSISFYLRDRTLGGIEFHAQKLCSHNVSSDSNLQLVLG